MHHVWALLDSSSTESNGYIRPCLQKTTCFCIVKAYIVPAIAKQRCRILTGFQKVCDLKGIYDTRSIGGTGLRCQKTVCQFVKPEFARYRCEVSQAGTNSRTALGVGGDNIVHMSIWHCLSLPEGRSNHTFEYDFDSGIASLAPSGLRLQ